MGRVTHFEIHASDPDTLVRFYTEAVPLTPIPGVGWLAYAMDPDGNLFGMMQPDPSAA